VSIFADYGFSLEKIAKMGFGPILFREEIKYLKEVNLFENIRVHCKVKQMRDDASRWSFFQEIFKSDDTPAVEIIVDGAWIDLSTRKLGMPTEKLIGVMKQFPRTEDFEWTS
jgi:acyl-CoA thioester hydrolase